MTMPAWVQILLTGVTAAIINQLLGWWKDSRREKAKVDVDKRYTALRLAVALERFAIQCAEQIATVESEVRRAHMNGVEPECHSIAFPSLHAPESSDLRWISTDLASEVLAVQPQINFSKGAIGWAYESGPPEDMADEFQNQLARRGLQCWEIGIKVRLEYGIAPATFDLGDWDFIKVLRKHAKTT
jgi:hypothetical protein